MLIFGTLLESRGFHRIINESTFGSWFSVKFYTKRRDIERTRWKRLKLFGWCAKRYYLGDIQWLANNLMLVKRINRYSTWRLNPFAIAYFTFVRVVSFANRPSYSQNGRQENSFLDEDIFRRSGNWYLSKRLRETRKLNFSGVISFREAIK